MFLKTKDKSQFVTFIQACCDQLLIFGLVATHVFKK